MQLNTCIRTGCLVYLEEYGYYSYGDAFRLGPHKIRPDGYLFRFVEGFRNTVSGRKLHFTVRKTHLYFRDEPIRTLVSLDTIYHGYEGVPIT